MKKPQRPKGTEQQRGPENFDYNVRVMFRGILASLFIAAAMLIQGCTYTRSAPLLNIEANGNTVTPGGF